VVECAECGGVVDTRIGRCTSCGAWSVDLSSSMSAIRIPRVDESWDTQQSVQSDTQQAPRITQPPVISPFVQASSAPKAYAPPAGPSRAWPAPKAADRAQLPAPGPTAAPVTEPDVELTTISSRRGRTKFWTLALPDDTVEVVVGGLIIGRQASPIAEWPDARLLTIDDPTRSMSKNHAAFIETHGTLVVQDLQSTNGVYVMRADGHEVDLGPWEQVTLDSGSRVELGDVIIRVLSL
jgi:hypothetical protein